MDPDGSELESAFKGFVQRYGYNPGNRLLFYFSGHGYSRESPLQGYLVPADAPDPRKDEAGFYRKALSMSQIHTWCREMVVRHALFLFDSCFSGTIFKTRDLPKFPPHISDVISRPVRQFISAGDAGEPVPAKSVFAPSFIRALRGDGDIDHDGYVTGTELGMYLHRNVLDYRTGQTPQCGKLRDPDYDEGDFVFVASGAGVIEKPEKNTLSIEANVSGVEVFVDGKRAGVAPLKDFAVSAGKHQVLVQKKGYRPYQKSVEVQSGRSVSLSVYLDPETVPNGRIFVETEPAAATVRILNIGEPFSQGMELSAGSYRVEVSAAGYEKKVMEVNLRAGEDKRLDVRLSAVAAGPLPEAAQAASDKKIRNSLGMEFVYIPPGTFTMGSPSSEPDRDDDEVQHKVTLTRGYYLQTTEVTQVQWQAVVRNNPSYFKYCGDDCPVERVSWDDAQTFIRQLNQKEGGSRYRLPTEAEWEYAARAGSQERFCLGDSESELDSYAWHSANSGGQTHPVAGKRANAWGLYDMHGNVWEWCQDWFGDYPSTAVTDPTGPSGGSCRVFRGGSWRGFLLHENCRSANRDWYVPGVGFNNMGLRLARNP